MERYLEIVPFLIFIRVVVSVKPKYHLYFLGKFKIFTLLRTGNIRKDSLTLLAARTNKISIQEHKSVHFLRFLYDALLMTDTKPSIG